MTLQSINLEQRLYVHPCGNGYSCIGFDVAQRLATETATWAGRPDLVPSAPLGTAAHYAQYESAMDAGRTHASLTGARCPAELVPQLVGLEGRRVEVIDAHGDRRRFWVGKSTGWRPCHLEIKTRRSMGGMAVYGAPFKSVRVVEESRR